jgi:deoxyribodipyrimidine photolyase-related protein
MAILVEYFEDESYLEFCKNEEVFVYELFDNYLQKKYIKTFQISLQSKIQIS